VLTVSDTGPGIAPEHRKRIFEAFYQEPGTGSLYGGTGLGLAIVERLAESLGGKVEVESILGEGSMFTFRLPCVPVIEAGRPMAFRPSLGGDTASGAPGFAGEDGPPGSDAVLLSPSRLRDELGHVGFGRLLEAVDGELIPLRATLSPVLIVDEWKGFFDRTKAVFGALGSPLLEDWIFRCSQALEDLDGPRLRRLAAELDTLRPR
jgi:hypothetical protein